MSETTTAFEPAAKQRSEWKAVAAVIAALSGLGERAPLGTRGSG